MTMSDVPILYYREIGSVHEKEFAKEYSKVVIYNSFKQLLIALWKITKQEFDLCYPLLLVVDKDIDGYNDKVQLIQSTFQHLNLLIIEPSQLEAASSEAYHSHEYFLKNRFKRMQTWVGLSGPGNNLSRVAKRHNSTQANGSSDSSPYPKVPNYIHTMDKNLISLYSQNELPADYFTKPVFNDINFMNEVLHLYEHRKFYIEQFLVESWYFPAHDLNYDELVYVCFLIFKRVFKGFSRDDPKSDLVLSDNQLVFFLIKVRELYNAGNQFHNFRHAVDVLQAVFYYLLKLNLLPRESLIYQKLIIHNYKKHRKSGAEKQRSSDKSVCADDIINDNEKTVDNNDNLSKECEEIDPTTEYKTYLKAPNLYKNQLKTYQKIIDAEIASHQKSQEIIEFDDSDLGVHFKYLKPYNKLLTNVETLALVVAALGHDSGHPGLNNIFLTKNDSPLAFAFKKESVLESYHYTIFNQLLKQFWPNLFNCSGIITLISNSILATDMDKHFMFIDKIWDLEKEFAQADHGSFEISAQLLSQLLLKCADISNITRPLNLSAQWGITLGKEMNEIAQLSEMIAACEDQTKLKDSLIELYEQDDGFENMYFFFKNWEQQEAIESSNTAKKDNDEILNEIPEKFDLSLKDLIDQNQQLPGSQSFFIEKISITLFEKIGEILPVLNFTLTILNKNLNFWKLLLSEKNTKDS